MCIPTIINFLDFLIKIGLPDIPFKVKALYSMRDPLECIELYDLIKHFSYFSFLSGSIIESNNYSGIFFINP